VDELLPGTDAERIEELVLAGRILCDHGVLDGFGHVSVRSAANPSHFLMARAGLPPELVTGESVVEYDETGEPAHAHGAAGPGERFIHSEIFRARPDVRCVVHSHTQAVIPFALVGTPLKAVIHTAYFLGTRPTPIFEVRDAMGPRNSMLVDTPAAGAALARALEDRAVVLMRGHGMSVVGPSIHDAVYRAIYTRVNAEIEAEALRFGNPRFLNDFEVDRDEPVSVQWRWWAARAAR
jgi:HCOMODA/2-hydroxy-3-carboxy-muconic semialdehyde decarboxylase